MAVIRETNTLITSGAYVGEEMQAEFGRIPPAFLPIGSGYLVQQQLKYIKDRYRKFISLPADFDLTELQLKLLRNEEVSIVRVNPEKSLGMSVLHAILETGVDRPLEILHGDTLILSNLSAQADAVSVAAVTEQYKWGLVSTSQGRITGVYDSPEGYSVSEQSQMLSGYFFFEDTWELLRCLAKTDLSFVGALSNYTKARVTLARADIETLDCGHLKTLYASRRHLAATRHFNSLSIDDYFVRKRSSDYKKIAAEANWLRTIPIELQPFSARIVEADEEELPGEYLTLYASYPTVAELYLAQSSRLVWRQVMNSCVDYLTRAYKFSIPGKVSPFKWLVIDKLNERLRDYPRFLPSSNEPLRINGESIGTLESIVKKLEAVVAAAPEHPLCVMHGDFCFSNMLFDLRSDRIMLIDPRGIVDGEITIYGDIRYDIAKLGHSVLGRYDQIMADGLRASGLGNDLRLEIPADPRRDWLDEMFLSKQVEGLSFDSPEVKAAVVSLFLSMIPLHAEDSARQWTLFSNGLRLFAQFNLHR